ncbi:mitogen-activated protein kinase 15 [Ochotona princeps]|uniref:mitogen-activated protein kinase 15 n=1 Tax=Ochotona princeps TaxID=9978 RepID=UPI0027149CC7|nr:mitogen-activated protein kinase 15 [Ochotona princeps]
MCAAEVDSLVAQRFRIKRRLGKGAYGIVWRAVDRRTGEVVAIKKIFDAFRDKMDAQRTFREIMLLQEFEGHPNIIRLLDVIRAQNDRDIYLVFESMDIDLGTVIAKGSLLQDAHKRYIFYQLLRATQSIHASHVIHRDQKPSNVLLDANCLVKLCDFGLARPLGGEAEGSGGQALTEYVATRWYRAPEVLLSSPWYTPGVDMWSLGCILGEMLRGRPLFPGTSTLHQLELILQAIPLPSEADLLALGSSYSSLVLHHLGARPRQELHALLPPDTPAQALDLLQRLLVFAPDKRLSAAQALRHPYVQRFHCPGQEWTREAAVRLPAPGQLQLSAAEYRDRLYQMLLQRRHRGSGRTPEGSGCTPPGTERRASRARPAQEPAPRLQGGCRHDGEREVPGRRPAPRLQLPAPARAHRPPEVPSAPAGVRPGAGAPAPSLTSEATAQAANRVLLRDYRTRASSRGPRRSPPARPQPPLCAQVPLREAAEPRPGRKQFGSAASQGVQGAARAALGGYSQAYGTVCGSALARLPLLPGPRA